MILIQKFIDLIRGDFDQNNKNCECLSVVNPVCATNGQTYINYCILECEKQTVLYQAACIGSSQSDYVNGGNNNLQNQQQYQDYKVNPYYATSSCKNCPKNVENVCGSNGKTYNNKCEAECRGFQIKFLGKCP